MYLEIITIFFVLLVIYSIILNIKLRKKLNSNPGNVINHVYCFINLSSNTLYGDPTGLVPVSSFSKGLKYNLNKKIQYYDRVELVAHKNIYSARLKNKIIKINKNSRPMATINLNTNCIRIENKEYKIQKPATMQDFRALDILLKPKNFIQMLYQKLKRLNWTIHNNDNEQIIKINQTVHNWFLYWGTYTLINFISIYDKKVTPKLFYSAQILAIFIVINRKTNTIL